MNETLIFVKIIPLAFNTLIPVRFLLSKHLWNSSFDFLLSCTAVFLSMSSILSLEINSYLRKEENIVRNYVRWLWKVEPHHQMQFGIISRALLFLFIFKGSYSVSTGDAVGVFETRLQNWQYIGRHLAKMET